MFFRYLLAFVTSFTLLSASSVFSQSLSKKERIKLFSNNTISGKHLRRNFAFKRFYGDDGTLIGLRGSKKRRLGQWQAKRGKICHQWNNRKKKCSPLQKEGAVIQMYNKRKTVVILVFSSTVAGNNIDNTTVTQSKVYSGPMIDGHTHLGGNYKPDFMIKHNSENNIVKMIVFPRLFRSKKSSGISEKRASKIAKKYQNHIWMTVGLQRRDLFRMNWHKPKGWWKKWLAWARKEILSGRRRGMGELTARHHAYTRNKFTERDFPIDSEVVDDLLKLSAETQRPLVLHAEGEKHVVKAIKIQLKRHPKAILVWAHACGRSSPLLVAKLLSTYPNLYCDLGNMTDTGNYGSFWPRKEKWMWQWEKNGTILPQWVKVMERFPTRFYLGMDTNSWKGWIKRGRRSRRSRLNRFRAVLPQLREKTIKEITVLVPTRLFGDR